MQNNRFICSIIIAAMIISAAICPVSADTGNYSADEYGFEVKIAEGLGVIDDYNADEKVTVGQFRKAIDALSPGEELSDFYIKNAKGDSNEIRCVDAAAIMCDILGYGIFSGVGITDNTRVAEMFSTAQNRGILKGVKEGAYESLTMQGMANMLYNVLSSKALNTSYTGNGGYNASISDRKFAEDALNMQFVDGAVQQTKFSSIVSPGGTSDNTMVINGVSYKCDINGSEEYIGMSVKALVCNEKGNRRVLALFDNGKTKQVMADDIDYDGTTANEISYFDAKGGRKTLRLDSNADVLYNCTLQMSKSAEDFKIKQGRLVLIDNDNDGKYDVVRIEEYKTMKVFSVSMFTKKISDAYGNVANIEKLIDEEYPVYEKGIEILPQNIPLGSIAAYLTDKNGYVTRIYVSSDIAAGTVRNIKANKDTITLDDTVYSYTDEIKSEIEKVGLGCIVNVYLDVYGEIAYFDVSKDAYLYGYMTAFETSRGLNAPRMKVFTQSNEFKIFSAADTIDIDGNRISSAEAFEYSADNPFWDEAGKINQIIKYKLNSKGLVTAVRTASNYDTGNHERMLKEKDGVYTYYADPNTICADTRLNALTKVFLIPTDFSYDNKFKCGTYDILKNDNDYTCQVYDIDENRYADLIVARIDPYGKSSVDDLYGNVYMVDEIGTFINDHGDEAPLVVAQQLAQSEPKEVEIKFNTPNISATIADVSVTSGTLKQGDIIMVKEDGTHSGEMGNLKIWYRPGEVGPYEDVKRIWYSEKSINTFISDGYAYCAGKIIEIVKDGVIINNQPLDTEDYSKWNRIITISGTTPVHILDKNRGEIVRGSVADLESGDTVFSLIQSGKPLEFVIYRNFQ